MWENYAFHVPEAKKVRYIIHADAKNEADDQFTIAHALMTDKLDIRGIIAGHFEKGRGTRYPEKTTATESYKEIVKILELMGLNGKYPVYIGAEEGIPNEQTPIVTDAAKFIVEEAMREDDSPLFIGMQGAITDLACAILMEPRICERMTCIWIGGGKYPEGEREFNLMNDIAAANVVFASRMPVWQVTKAVYKQFAVSFAELQLKVKPYGAIGEYLFQQMMDFNMSRQERAPWPHGETWELGDEGCVCALLEGKEHDNYDMLPAPRFAEDMTYIHGQDNRPIRVYRTMDARMDLEDLFAKLQINYPKN